MILRILIPGLLAVLVSSCGNFAGVSAPSRPYLAGLGVTERVGFSNPAEASSFWDGDSVTGPPSIRINRDDQRAYFYKGGQLVGVSPVSTGSDEHITPKGTFKVTQMSADHKSSLYGQIIDDATGQVVNPDADTRIHKPGPGQTFVAAPMPHFLRFNGGIGMHAGFLPGYAASHGCVRLPADMAQKFFENSKMGMPVIVD